MGVCLVLEKNKTECLKKKKKYVSDLANSTSFPVFLLAISLFLTKIMRLSGTYRNLTFIY